MKSALIFFVVLSVLSSLRADDDGKYRPDVYSNGRYWSNYNNRYYDDRYRNFYGNNYYPYSGYQSAYYNNLRPYQQLLAPLAVSGKTNSAADNSVLSKPVEAPKPSVVTIISPSSTALPLTVSPTTASPILTTALPRVAYAKFGNEGFARIVAQDNDLLNNGYHYSFQTENGINAAETGAVDSANSRGGTRVKGFYEYVGDDGLLYRVDYTADENGYHASGAHIPTAN